VALYPDHAQDKETLLDLADRAMYTGKRNSRNVTYLANEVRTLTASEQK
jgi:two-component system, cell cycle response regulator